MASKIIVMEHIQHDGFDTTSVYVAKKAADLNQITKCSIFLRMARGLSEELGIEVQLGVKCSNCEMRDNCFDNKDEFDFLVEGKGE